MRTEEELKELAKRVITNEVFMASDEESISNAFMLLVSLGAEFPAGTVALYEEYSKALPRGINGYPMFSSCGYLSKEEFKIFIEHYKKYNELLNS
ncbi:hypothetical protein ACWKTZ_21110 [Bacillus cereus]